MRVILSCHCCVIALFAASLGVSAQRLLEDYTHHRPRWIDPYHRAPKKGPITAAPEYPVGFRDDYNQKLAKRGQACDAGYHLCAESLGGDCCPEKYDCATDSCYAATVNPLTWNCAGKVGWYPCEDSGCCPVGLVCIQGGDCSPPAGSTTTCPPNYYLCPASMSYGCCESGFACGTAICSIITTKTATYTATVTSVETGKTTEFESVITTTMLPTEPDRVPTQYTRQSDTENEQKSIIEKFYPQAIVKKASFDDGQDGDNSTSTPVALIGGVIGGGVFLLICIIIGIIWVRYRLKHNELVIETEKSKDSRPSYLVAKMEVESTTNTPLNSSNAPQPGRDRNTSTSSMGLSGTVTPSAAPTTIASDPNANMFSQPSSPRVRYPSMESMSVGTTSYFDPQRISAQTVPSGYQYSADSTTGTLAATSHRRQWSVGSTMTREQPCIIVSPQELDGKKVVPELYGSDGISSSASTEAKTTTAYPLLTPTSHPEMSASLKVTNPPSPSEIGARRRSGSAPNRPPLSHLNHSRRRSDGTSGGCSGSGVGQHYTRVRSDSSSTNGGGLLDVVTEITTEGHMHGFYGPSDRQVGQTAVGLRGDTTISHETSADKEEFAASVCNADEERDRR